MKIIDQGCYFTTVNRIRKEELSSKTFFLKTDFEATVDLVVDIKSFKIKEAKWEINRAEDSSKLGKGTLQELAGKEAYFNGGRSVRKVIGTGDDETLKGLFLECIRGFIQAETYIFKERGYKNKQAYYDYWKTEQIDSCRYFSHLDREVCTWFEYVGDYIRKNNLFNRNKQYTIIEDGAGMIQATGNLIDSYHEMNAEFSFSKKSKIIEKCYIKMPRVPGPVCSEISEKAPELVGIHLDSVVKKNIAEIIGGSEGCFHLVNIVYDMIRAAQKII